MSSATKTLELLTFFSATRPEIGLSQLCRIAGRDKATTYRHLQALEYAGFVEKNPATRHYRLGPAVLHLAQVREATVPRKAGVQLPLSLLADATGETAHVSVLSGTVVHSLASCESPRHGTRAVIDITTFPLHATATGICALAFGPADLFDVATAHLERFTANTPTTPQAVSGLVDSARATGFGSSNGNYEPEIYSLSAPVFDQSGLFVGAVTVASVASRFTPDLERTIKAELATASRDITHNWGGTLPARVETAWANSLSSSHTMDATS